MNLIGKNIAVLFNAALSGHNKAEVNFPSLKTTKKYCATERYLAIL